MTDKTEDDTLHAEVQAEIDRLWAGEVQDISALAKLALSVKGAELKSTLEACSSLDAVYQRALASDKSDMVCCGLFETYVGRYRDKKMMAKSDCEEMGGKVLHDGACDDTRRSSSGPPGGLLNDICRLVGCTVKDAKGIDKGYACGDMKDLSWDDIEGIEITLRPREPEA